MGSDLGGGAGEIFPFHGLGKIPCPGEKGGVAVMGFGKRGSRADSMRGVDCVESTSFVGSKHILESMSFLVWSELVRYLLLLGVDLFIVLRRERPLSLEASTRSDGLVSLLFSGQVASVLA